VEGDQKTKTSKKKSPPLRTSQGTWARSNAEKAHAFVEDLVDVFQPHSSKNKLKKKKHIQLLQATYQLKPPTGSRDLKFSKSSAA
jgi:hypothetical protein